MLLLKGRVPVVHGVSRCTRGTVWALRTALGGPLARRPAGSVVKALLATAKRSAVHRVLALALDDVAGERDILQHHGARALEELEHRTVTQRTATSAVSDSQ